MNQYNIMRLQSQNPRAHRETVDALKFTLTVFGILIVPLAIVAPFLALNGFLIGGIVLLAPGTVPGAEAAQYLAWSFSPLALLALIFGAGMMCARIVRGRKSHLAAWLVVWAVFSALLFVMAWFVILLLTSLGAADYSAARVLTWTTQAAFIVTAIGQVGVVVWLWFAARMVTRWENV